MNQHTPSIYAKGHLLSAHTHTHTHRTDRIRDVDHQSTTVVAVHITRDWPIWNSAQWHDKLPHASVVLHA